VLFYAASVYLCVYVTIYLYGNVSLYENNRNISFMENISYN
jgi:hypothetical protein